MLRLSVRDNFLVMELSQNDTMTSLDIPFPEWYNYCTHIINGCQVDDQMIMVDIPTESHPVVIYPYHWATFLGLYYQIFNFLTPAWSAKDNVIQAIIHLYYVDMHWQDMAGHTSISPISWCLTLRWDRFVRNLLFPLILKMVWLCICLTFASEIYITHDHILTCSQPIFSAPSFPWWTPQSTVLLTVYQVLLMTACMMKKPQVWGIYSKI